MQFFARKQHENATRPEGLHPSQGGKYVGFGSGPLPQKKPDSMLPLPIDVDSVTSLFSKGLSTLGTVVATGAETIKTAAATRMVSAGVEGVCVLCVSSPAPTRCVDPSHSISP